MCFVGIGGGGSNIVEQIAKIDDSHGFVHMNSDLQALQQKKHGSRLILGYEEKQGLGCGANVKCGTKLFNDAMAIQFQAMIPEETILCLVSTLGGGVGSGVTPQVARYLKATKQKFEVIVVMPFIFEGKKRHATAIQSLSDIKQYRKNVTLIHNDDWIVQGSKKGFTESLVDISREVYKKVS